MTNLSSANYRAYEDAYNVLNAKLFDSKLPPVVLTLRAKKGTNGYAWANRFTANGTDSDETRNDPAIEHGAFDEIAINPAHAGRDPKDVLGTLLHEMVHVWQFHFGKIPRSGYHDAQWANKMIEVGLRPFNVKDPTKMTGQACSHTIEPLGAADCVFDEIVEAFGVNLVVELPTFGKTKKPANKNKVKFTCLSCGCNAWGKESLKLICADCNETMRNLDADEGDSDDEGEDDN